MLAINELTYRIGDRVLIDRATASIQSGWKVGLVGRNGAGKSTLLKLIAGDLTVDGGSIELQSGLRMGTVRQEAPSGDETPHAHVLAADTERDSLMAEAETATDPERIGEVHARLIDIGAHAAPARAAAILDGLGFPEAMQHRALADFSGGWRMRVALAAVLFAEPELLLLDEPTNHLDLEATVWLEGYLRSYAGTVILVSHDRSLLNNVVERTLHLDRAKLTMYVGGWDAFARQRAAKAALQSKAIVKQQAERQRIQAFVDRFRAKASKARQAQSRIKLLERMEPLAAMVEDEAVNFDFPQPGALAPPLVNLDRCDVGYGGPPVLQRLSLRIDQDDRIALLGPNGNGKSTLVKLLAGRLAPVAGSLHRSARLRVGYFAQHQAEELDLAGTPITHMAAVLKDVPVPKVRAHLGRFGFSQSRGETRVGDLSGGEKAKLLLALSTRDAPHILLLDEPTNHLDVEARDALVQALNAYEGAIVLVSHDPHLVGLVADRLWLVADGTVKPFDGDIEDYRRQLLQGRSLAHRSAEGSGGGAAAEASKRDRRDERRAAAERRSALAPLRRAAQDAERKVAILERARDDLSRTLADPQLYAGTPARVAERKKALAEAERKLKTAEEAWLAAAGALEAAGQSVEG